MSVTGYDPAKYSAVDEQLTAASERYRHRLIVKRRFEQVGGLAAAAIGFALFCTSGLNLRLLGVGLMLYGVIQVSIASLTAQQALIYDEINLLVVKVDRVIAAAQRGKVA